MITNIDKVLAWASNSTGEGRRFGDSYYWTQPVNTALFRLTRYESYFVGLIGLVGTGKSSAIRALEDKISSTINMKLGPIADSKIKEENEKRKEDSQPNLTCSEELAIRQNYCTRAFVAKWHNNFWTMFKSDIAGPYSLEYRKKVKEKAVETPKAQKLIKQKEHRIQSSRYEPLSSEEAHNRAIEELKSELSTEEAEKILTAKVLEDLRLETVLQFLRQNVHTLLLDMPDYSQKGCWKINKDLDSIGALWNLLKQRSKINILVCLQQELVMKDPHLILGKMDKIMLKTLTVDQMLEAYKQFFQTYEPFTEDALRRIAKLSRGVFRRFKNYIRLTLETALIENVTDQQITVELVKRAITKDQLRMDMDLELSDFLKSSEKKTQAFSILDFILDNPAISQKEISDILGINPNAVGNIIKQLCLHGYLRVERGKGTEWLVSLKDN